MEQAIPIFASSMQHPQAQIFVFMPGYDSARYLLSFPESQSKTTAHNDCYEAETRRVSFRSHEVIKQAPPRINIWATFPDPEIYPGSYSGAS